MHYFSKFIILFIFLFSPLFIYSESFPVVGIIVPLEHPAMIEIVNGIKEALADQPVNVIVQQAHGDLNLVKTIATQFRSQKVKAIIPIGTTTSKITLSQIKKIPVICAAAIQMDASNATGVIDEVDSEILFDMFPHLEHITIFYSPSDKMIPELKKIKEYGEKNQKIFDFKMVSSLSELNFAAQHASKDTQAFLVLKDHLVVSGIPLIKKYAVQRQIPLIASDEASVFELGATIAFGVKEKNIGIQAGNLAKKILNGLSVEDLSFEVVEDASLFVNDDMYLLQKQINTLPHDFNIVRGSS
jgi:putative ABC transport system substrate-binding protein